MLGFVKSQKTWCYITKLPWFYDKKKEKKNKNKKEKIKQNKKKKKKKKTIKKDNVTL